MAVELNVMQSSPLDRAGGGWSDGDGLDGDDTPDDRDRPVEWVPSRFNARTTDREGRLIVWNSLTASISVFEAAQTPVVERALSQKGFTAPPRGLVEYLDERGFIIPEGTDEHGKLDHLIGKQHYRSDVLELILMPSEDCNFRCVYCYEDFQRGTMLPEVRRGVKNLIESRADQLRHLNVRWFGGEPLYGFEAIEDLAPFARDVAEEHGVRYASSMTTNGYLLTPDVADRLLAWDIRRFQITLDGAPEDHDAKRVGRDGSGTFRRIHENLRALRHRDDEFTVRIRSNFDRENVDSYDEFLAILEEDFAGDDRFEVSFHGVGKWGGPNDADLDTCGVEEKREVQSRLKDSARESGLNVARDLTLRGGLGRHVCYAARPYNFLIGADGKVMKCTVALDKKDHNVVGRLTPEGELDLDHEKMALWTAPNWQTDEGCRKCQVVPICQGNHCPLVRIEKGNRPCTPVRSRLHDKLRETLAEKAEDERRFVRVGGDPDEAETERAATAAV